MPTLAPEQYFLPADQYFGPEVEDFGIDPRFGWMVALYPLLQSRPPGAAPTDPTLMERFHLAKEHDREVVEVLNGKVRGQDMGRAINEICARERKAFRHVGAVPLGSSLMFYEHGEGIRSVPVPRFLESVNPATRSAWIDFRGAGLHMHGTMDNPDIATIATFRMLPWLAPLIQITANSPFEKGRFTAHDSFRAVKVLNLPQVHGLTRQVSTLKEQLVEAEQLFEAIGLTVKTMKDDGTYQDAMDFTMNHLPARASMNNPTAELRICDVGTRQEARLLASNLAAGLLLTARLEALRFGLEGLPPVSDSKIQILNASKGRSAPVILPEHGQISGHQAQWALFKHLAPALELLGTYEETKTLLELTIGDREAQQPGGVGNEAELQKHALKLIVEERMREGLPVWDHELAPIIASAEQARSLASERGLSIPNRPLDRARANLLSTNDSSPKLHPGVAEDHNLVLAWQMEHDSLTDHRPLTPQTLTEVLGNKWEIEHTSARTHDATGSMTRLGGLVAADVESKFASIAVGV